MKVKSINPHNQSVVGELRISTKQENILVVTHSGPIKMTVFLMMNNNFTPQDFYRFSDLFKLNNTGITFCEKDEKGNWSVQAYNDHSHLG